MEEEDVKRALLWVGVILWLIIVAFVLYQVIIILSTE